MKRYIFSIIICIALICNFSLNAFAEQTKIYKIRSSSDYGQCTAFSGSGYFDVEYTGFSGRQVSLRFKTQSSDNNSFVYISIQQPNGAFFNNNIAITGNTEKTFYINSSQTGIYRIHYIAYSSSSSIFMQCWID